MSGGKTADPTRLARWRRLLAVRQRQERSEREELAREERVAALLAERRAALSAARQAGEDAARARRRESVRPQVEAWSAGYLERLLAQGEDLGRRLVAQAVRVERARALALEARRARRGVETLVDRERARLKAQSDKREQRGHDEVAQRRFRKTSLSPSGDPPALREEEVQAARPAAPAARWGATPAGPEGGRRATHL